MMASYWPTAEAKKQLPEIAEAMNRLQKLVVSRSLDKPTWNNTTLLNGDGAAEVRKLKSGSGSPIVVMGSGTLIAALAKEGLIDEYTLIFVPVVLGSGRTLFERLDKRFAVKRTKERTFDNGNVVVTYEPQ